MRRRVRGFAAAAALVLVVCTTSLVSGGTAAAAEPIVVGDCSTTIQGTPGQPLAMSPSAVLAPVLNVVRAIPGGGLLVTPISQQIAKMGNIPLGVLPNADTTISGDRITEAALPKIRAAIEGIPLIGPLLSAILGGVQSALTSGCGIVVDVANTVAAPVQDGTDAVADASEKAVAGIIPGASTGPVPGTPGSETPGGGQTPGTGGDPSTGMPGPNQPPIGGFQPSGWSLYEPGLWNFGRSPMAAYGSIPFARPGLFAPSPGVRYGGSVPGYTPQFGILGTDNPGDDVQAAGRADALTPPEGQKIALPVLLAVLTLSMVTAALVRTWVLRRTPAAAL